MLLMLELIVLPIYPLTCKFYILASWFQNFVFIEMKLAPEADALLNKLNHPSISPQTHTHTNTDKKFNKKIDLNCDTIKRNFGHIFLD